MGKMVLVKAQLALPPTATVPVAHRSPAQVSSEFDIPINVILINLEEDDEPPLPDEAQEEIEEIVEEEEAVEEDEPEPEEEEVEAEPEPRA